MFGKARQKFLNATAKVCKRHGKSLKTSRQKFVNATAKVFKHDKLKPSSSVAGLNVPWCSKS